MFLAILPYAAVMIRATLQIWRKKNKHSSDGNRTEKWGEKLSNFKKLAFLHHLFCVLLHLPCSLRGRSITAIQKHAPENKMHQCTPTLTSKQTQIGVNSYFLLTDKTPRSRVSQSFSIPNLLPFPLLYPQILIYPQISIYFLKH